MNKKVLLSAASCIGVVSTGYLTYKATRAADLKLDKEGALREDWKYRFGKTWGYFIPAILGGGGTIASVLLTQKITSKEIAAIGASAAMSTEMLRRYENKTRELLGDDQLHDIQRAIAEDEKRGITRCIAPPIGANSMFVNVNDKGEEGDDLFFDIFTKKWFRSSKEAVRIAEYHLNRNFILGAGASLENFYDFLGYKLTDAERKNYRYLGWGQDYIDDGFCWIDFGHQDAVSEETGEKYTILSYSVAPESLLIDE